MSYYYEGNGNFSTEEEQREKKRQSAPSQPTNKDMGSWIVIAVMFAIAWPIGLFLLIRKLREDDGGKKTTTRTYTKTTRTQTHTSTQTGSRATVKSTVSHVTRSPGDSDKSALVLKIVGIALAAVGLLACVGTLADLSYALEYGYLWQLAEDLFVATGFLVGGGVLLVGSGAMKRRMRRYAKYLAVAGTAQSVSISRLTAAAEVSERRVERDLEVMIEKGMWGEGAYVDLSVGKLFRSASAGEQYYERQAAPAAPPEAQQGYSGILRQIRRANDRIADEDLSAKIDRLEEIAGRIFRLIENEPEKKAKAATFLNYYLPTTQKLLEAYAEFEEAGVSGGNLSQAKRKIEQTMDNIVVGFERQLDELYRTDALDIDSDIRVMETMLRRDTARVEDDFRVQTSGGNGGDDFAAPDEGGEQGECTVCRVTLHAIGEDNRHKLEIVQAIHEASGRSLHDCARLVDLLPCDVLECGDMTAALTLQRKLKQLGARASVSISHGDVR